MRQICKKHVNHPNSKGPRCWRGFLKDEASLVVAASSRLFLAAPLSGHGGLRGNTVFSFLQPLPCLVTLHGCWGPRRFPCCQSGSLQTSSRSSAVETWTLRLEVPPHSGTSIHGDIIERDERKPFDKGSGANQSLSFSAQWPCKPRGIPRPGRAVVIGLGFSCVFSGKGGTFSLLEESPEPLRRFH